MGKLFTGFVKVTAFPVEALVFRVKYHYEDKTVQGRKISGPALVVSNHTSVWDFAQVMQTFFGRHIRCLVADLMFNKSKAFAFFLKHLDAIKISREGKNFSFIEESVEILKNGGVVEVYPESRIPREDEEAPLEFKPSFAYIAMLSKAPIIPMYTDGNYFGKGRANVMIGKPIDISTIIDEELDASDNIKRITDYVRGKILELRDETEKRKKQK
jgi:1-acyl-sn-glycerol-3-phosphate acyltransferase